MAIAASDVRGVFTKKLIDVYQERISPKAFLRSFFPTAPGPIVSKNVAIEVERGFEKIAVDVVRGTEGNRNTFSKSTEKIWEPPHYREYFDAKVLDLYDRVLGSQSDTNAQLFAALLQTVSNRLGLLQDKIERRMELQCAQVLQTGIVTLDSGVNIDYKRKASSIVVLGTAPNGGWFNTNSDVFTQLESGCEFLRTVGKSGDDTFVAIFGKAAWSALLKNTVFLNRQTPFQMGLDQVAPPQRNAVGAAFHGTLTCGSYRVQCWTYPEFYDDENTGVSTPYITSENVILIPAKPRFHMAHGLCPQLITEPGQVVTQTPFMIGEYMDQRKKTHDFDIQTCPLAVPVAIDQIYTMKAV